ncbi:hypothetical protein [Pseudomonas syringae group sp. J254-4]|uniref:hypothetical protein n=1 Tax=Pseudomonas syringae group sp. J254-4 TaxID=3079589 RepID=UPI0029085EF2|nr:hypothetical protein [Pseudomonas syringae group sp. J254-4]MDU8455121.1 hypothetical protein [Pseudomonas syringae group sp. J254-4]
MESSNKRILFGKKYRAIHNSDAPSNLGYLDVVFEQINGELYLVNEKDFFCETCQVFVTSNYHDIDSRFETGELFQIEAMPTTQDWKEGDCRYVTTATKVESRLPRKAALQIFSTELPSPNEKTIYTDAPPFTTLILIKNGTSLYGPFQTSSESDIDGSTVIKLSAVEGPFPGKSVTGSIRKYRYEDIEPGVAHYDVRGDRYSFLLRAEMLEQQYCEYIDFASDEEVVKLGSELMKKVNFKSFTKHEQMMFRAALSKSKNIPSNSVEQLNRFFALATVTADKLDSLDSALHDYLQTSIGQDLLSKHIDSREEVYLRRFRVEKEEKLTEEFSALTLKVDKLSKLQKSLEAENQSATEKLEQQNANFKAQQRVFVDEARNKERSELEAEITKAKTELKLLKDEAQPYKDLAALKSDITSADARLKVYQEQSTMAKQSKDLMEDELKQRDEELRKRLFTLRPYVEAISGMTNPTEELLKILPHSNAREVDPDLMLAERNRYIDELRLRLAHKGRHYPKDFIANLLISIQQSFIVILSGLPGVGKTSLIKILADAKNLSSRMLNISVGRGWTSQRDLIGYFNPLSNRMIPAPTGFYQYIKSCQHEKFEAAAPLWILLDEANLSAIEHYWAPFMGMADKESDKILRVNDTELPIQIPSSLRFIGTINNDLTTEPLSPRLIDRAPIITLVPNGERYEDEGLDTELDALELPVSHSTLHHMFDVDQGLPLEDERNAIAHQMAFLQEVKTVLMDDNVAWGKRCVISKRKENAIERYCLVAHPLMRSSSNMRALDYALSQHVLPLIQGSGDGYALRLEKLIDLLDKDDFKISHGLLRRMHETGRMDMNSFSYFSH